MASLLLGLVGGVGGRGCTVETMFRVFLLAADLLVPQRLVGALTVLTGKQVKWTLRHYKTLTLCRKQVVGPDTGPGQKT